MSDLVNTIPIAQESTLRQRVTAVLDAERPCGSTRRIALAAAILVCCCVVVPGGEAAEKKMETIRVVDGDMGGPISGATFFYDPDANEMRLHSDGIHYTARVQSNERGEVRLPTNAVDLLQFRVTHPRYVRSRFSSPMVVFGGVGRLAKAEWPYGKVDGQKIIRLWRPDTLKGQLRFADGKPAAGVELWVTGTVDDLQWLKKTGDGLWHFAKENAWRTIVVTDADGGFTTAVPPRTKRQAFSVVSATVLAAPFQHAVDTNDAGVIEIERGVVVRGVMVDADGKPVIKTHVSLRPAGLKREPMELLPDFVRLTYTDEKGRFQLAPAARGAQILWPYNCLPQRLELRRDQKEVDVQVQVAPYYDLKFDVSDTRARDPGVFNISLWGEIIQKDGGDPIPQLGLVYLNRAEKTIQIRVPRALQNAELRMNNFPRQVVYITDESGKKIPAGESTAPIKITDLTAPPKIKIWMSTGAPLQVNILEADGAEAKDIEVRGEATGEFGVRKLGAFHRNGAKWQSPGLYEGERVTVIVKRGDSTVRSRKADPIRLDATNEIEIRLPFQAAAK